MKLKVALLVKFAFVYAATSVCDAQSIQPQSRVVPASDFQWEQLNRARGDSSPQAATLWGDRKGTVATGFLVKFVDGFSSPPHIHNVSYRGVVIAGGIHNDDPGAKPMWMPTGSFWTQPAGEVHITSSRGAGVAYIEIEQRPYLVLSEAQASDNGERPINVTPSNFVWLDAANTSWIAKSTAKKGSNDGAEITFLWGNPRNNQPFGGLVKLPPGFFGELRSQAEQLQAVVVEGEMKLQLSGESAFQSIASGSYVSSEGTVTHQIKCGPGDACLICVRSKGSFTIYFN